MQQKGMIRRIIEFKIPLNPPFHKEEQTEKKGFFTPFRGKLAWLLLQPDNILIYKLNRIHDIQLLEEENEAVFEGSGYLLQTFLRDMP